jgi:hypothetical protein
MKYLFLAALLLASSALADSPDAVLKDYRKQAEQAVERLNQSLEKATTPLITKLVSSGDTEGAELLTSQLKTKLTGEPVSAPQASAAPLFSMYDEARAKALAPVQKSSIARIDSMLKTAGGPKLETVTELGKVRAEIEAGKLVDPKAIPVEWTYHSSLTGPAMVKVYFEPDGTAKSENNIGTWRMIKKGVLEVKYPKFTWTVTMKKDYAELVSPPTALRYLIPVKQ